MSLIVQNSSKLIDPETLKLKILLVALPGFGKTTFIAGCPNVGMGVSETGHGKGLLSVAQKGVDYVEINSYEDFAAFCAGAIFKDKDTIGCDSLSDMAKSFIKDKAISIPRAKGSSLKRDMGVPELDDYGVMAELTRKNTKRLINLPKHIVVSAGLRIDKPDPENLQADILVGPDFPGQMFLGSTAMFDIVLVGRTRGACRVGPDGKLDPRGKYTERYWMTEGSGGYLAKNRLSTGNKGSFLPAELVFDPENDTGTFADILRRSKAAYLEAIAKV